MPPPESNLNLSNRERAILILKWIDQGADMERPLGISHLLRKENFLHKNHQQFFSNEIDQFVYDKLKEKGLRF